MSPMPKGLVSQIYAFETTDRNFDDPFAEGLYSTASAGVLTGLKGYKMYLSNGSYNMYAFSENSSVYPPDLIDGISAPLKNGIDYLWWENLDQDVTTSQIHMPIVFQHVATQVVVDLSAGDGIKLDSLISASILPPTPGATLDIQTGIIESTYTYDTAPLTMGKNGFLTQAIVLPTKATNPMSLLNGTFDIHKMNDREIMVEVAFTASGVFTAATFEVKNNFFNTVASPNLGDAVKAIFGVMTYAEYTPNMIAMNPSTLFEIETLKDTSGRDLNLVTLVNGVKYVAGRPVVETTCIMPGYYFVGDMVNGASLVDYTSINIEFADDIESRLKNQTAVIVDED